MEAILGKLTQQAMNYAIRSGIAITSSYAISQCSRLLKHVNNDKEHQELQSLQERLSSKIRIISPAIDMIELISARGNTSLESAVTLTKSLRWDIQSLGVRLARAASDEEDSRRGISGSKTPAERLSELRLIIQDIRDLLLRIEDAVPLINLAITTSGANLSTNLPSSVSPSRLLQASTFLTAGDAQFSIDPSAYVTVGPVFVLSVYMLFSGHAQILDKKKEVRQGTWKEAIHKARVKLMRVPISAVCNAQNKQSATELGSSSGSSNLSPDGFSRGEDPREPFISSEGKANEFAYQLEIIEDLDDDRVHSYEEGDLQPGPYGGVELAGIRETIPIHQISKIFYANTGRILNIGNEDGPNSPVLLLKRDLNAQFPRRFMERSESEYVWHYEPEGPVDTVSETEDSQLDIDRQLHYESSVNERVADFPPLDQHGQWGFPPNLDPEWLAFEVYTEVSDDSSDDGQVAGNDSAYASGRPSFLARKSPAGSDFVDVFSNLHIGSPKTQHISQSTTSSPMQHHSNTPALGPIRTSLSLLEVLIRLTSLQQFQQSSHLAISDELLTFFLEDSSTTGAGGDREERRRARLQATQKVGFDPYSDSPVKMRDEAGHRDNENEAYEDGYEPTTPRYDYELLGSPSGLTQWSKERSRSLQSSPAWLSRREQKSSPRQSTLGLLSPPQQSPIPQSKTTQSLVRTHRSTGLPKAGSPLSRGATTDTDSSLGTSPGSLPTAGSKIGRAEGP